MAYKIAVASTDGITVNMHFGQTNSFYIVSVQDNGSYAIEGTREVVHAADTPASSCGGCGSNPSCNGGAGAGSSGCSGGHAHENPQVTAKVDTISDCRCLLCAGCGPGMLRQLERRAITTFQIAVPLAEALDKIIPYYAKVDHHQSLRKPSQR